MCDACIRCWLPLTNVDTGTALGRRTAVREGSCHVNLSSNMDESSDIYIYFLKIRMVREFHGSNIHLGNILLCDSCAYLIRVNYKNALPLDLILLGG